MFDKWKSRYRFMRKLWPHLKSTWKQLKQGPQIGERKTHVVSFWEMRDKWLKFGDYWELLGRDGDLRRGPNGGILAPAELQLVYFRIPKTLFVCQLAYVITPECIGDIERVDRIDRHNLRFALAAQRAYDERKA